MSAVPQEEQVYWRAIIEDLQEHKTVAWIAQELRVEDRQVWRWKAGERVPRGWTAIGLYLLHVKLCPDRQRQIGHVAELT